MEMSNAARQADEIEALTAIYGNEWCVLDEASRQYCVQISDRTDSPRWVLNLQVHLPENYPLESPPEYQINAFWLRGAERKNLENRLSQIYCENIGESVIFLWVEGVREFLQEKSDLDSSPAGRPTIQTTEEEDPDFDPRIVGDLDFLDSSASGIDITEDHCPDIIHGTTLTDRKSTFQGHLAKVTSKAQVSLVINRLLQNRKIANATHNMFAYRIADGSGLVYQGCDDDGETQAGSRMLHLLQIVKAENVFVMVSRWYGGIHLGPDRFKHINNCCRQVLEQNGFLNKKEGKKS
ncbi:protein IMPACT-like [Physella acuta]|uniref:protein IMPACT-like n=1 Tax=Physella acuta TaxID=109671 RepID=UPI0027DE0F6C|nr:protein IMPACT-like [Physella acuta]